MRCRGLARFGKIATLDCKLIILHLQTRSWLRNNLVWIISRVNRFKVIMIDDLMINDFCSPKT